MTLLFSWIHLCGGLVEHVEAIFLYFDEVDPPRGGSLLYFDHVYLTFEEGVHFVEAFILSYDQQRRYADRHRVEHSFEIRDMVFLRVQLHRMFPLRRGGVERMRPRLYGPYRVTQRVGEVAYEMELLEGSLIHNVLQVSFLKNEWGPHVTTSIKLPPLD